MCSAEFSNMHKALISGLLLATSLSSVLGVDLTIEEGKTGDDVVLATIAKIENSGVFPSDKRLLRRIAYVETRDGANELPEPNGGVWNVPMEAFLKTQRDPVLAGLRDKVTAAFATELVGSGARRWEDLEWETLSTPLWSGLAARLFISIYEQDASLPTSSDVSGQALFWKTWYNSSGNLERFISDVQQLEKDEGCTIKSDVVFVLDSSGSVGPDNFQEVLNFTYKFVAELDIGPTENQVGVVKYSSFGEIEFKLNTYLKKEELLDAIDNITFNSGRTNTADALCLVLESFSEMNGARLSEGDVFKLAVVLTDGHSNDVVTDCNYTSTIEAAEAVHNSSYNILVFAIGVTDGVDDKELKAIASRDDYITYLENFDEYLFRETSDEQTYELCERASIPVEFGQQVGTLERGGEVRYELEVPEGGVTINLCVSVGIVIFYGSFSVPNPNGALYDYIKEVVAMGESTCGDVFVQPEVEPTTTDRGKRQAKEGVSLRNTTTTLYISLKGVGEQNMFVLETSEGDNTAQGDSDDEFPVIVIAALTVIGVIVLLSFTTCTIVAICRKDKNKRERYAS